MQRLIGWLGIAVIMGLGGLLGHIVQKAIEPSLRSDWHSRLVQFLLFAGIVYLLVQVEELKQTVKRLAARLDRFERER